MSSIPENILAPEITGIAASNGLHPFYLELFENTELYSVTSVVSNLFPSYLEGMIGKSR